MYNQQVNIDRINSQIAELEKMKAQLPIPPITQNFQLTPVNREVIRYANSIDEVQKEMVSGDTPYFSKDMSVVWIKNIKGEVKTYELNEIVPKDEKDIKIEYLQAQIEELRRNINESNANTNESVAESTKSKESPIVETVPRFSKKSK